MELRFRFAVIAGKLTKIVARLLKRGATAAPGLVAETIDRDILKNTSSLFRRGVVLITGTNGKTTTANILACILARRGHTFLHNAAGSNLKRGIVSAVLENLGPGGKPKREFDFGVFECDEAALVGIASDVKPTVIVFNNLFRDQLDRYGEVETVRRRWCRLVEGIGPETKIVLNADDPGVRSLAEQVRFKENVFYFGLGDAMVGDAVCPSDKNLGEGIDSFICDFLLCPACRSKLSYAVRYFSHLGDYLCLNCGYRRPPLDLYARDICGSLFKLAYGEQEMSFSMPLRGLFNVYNFLAAFSAAICLGIDLSSAKEAAEGFAAAFGRQEVVEFGGKKLVITLVKNPVGFSQVLGTFFKDDEKKDIVVLLNDRVADGTDVSWIWDVDFSVLQGKVRTLIVGGTRLYDMGLRLKYDEVLDGPQHAYCPRLKDVFREISRADAGTFYVFPTYTALLDLKKHLAKLGYSDFWAQ